MTTCVRRLPVASIALPVGALIFVWAAVSHAQQAAPSGEEVYVDRLGCWNCHGKAGGGGAGAVIAKTPLPLRRFVSYVRLPKGEMPPYAPLLASDAELTIAYRWLDGVEAVKVPPAIAVNLTSAPAARADGQARAQVEIDITATAAEGGAAADVPAAQSLRYRLMLLTAAAESAANHAFEYQLAGHDDWLTFTTDEHGEVVLGPERGLVPGGVRDVARKNEAVRLRTSLGAGKHAVAVEVIDATVPASPVVLGIGTVVLRVE